MGMDDDSKLNTALNYIVLSVLGIAVFSAAMGWL